jgi:hypothetical protein
MGQLGTEDTVNYGSTPDTSGSNIPRVNLGTGVVAARVQAAVEFSCVLTTDFKVKCWGVCNVFHESYTRTQQHVLCAD